MPFREATALVTVEREGVMEAWVQKLSGKNPVLEVPIKGNYAPNVYVSALVVRGRVAGVQPTALVDLGKPAYKLGIAEIQVGWKAHELKVSVSSARKVYRVREKAKVRIRVRTADGKIPPPGSEVAVAAVDEGLLELMPNRSWELLSAMMGRRGYDVRTATAQMQVIGKRHFGLKALPQGGGGGRQPTREMFDTLLLWKARLPLDLEGEASVDIPLNDSDHQFQGCGSCHWRDGTLWNRGHIDSVDSELNDPFRVAPSREGRGSVQGRIYASEYDEREHGGGCFQRRSRAFEINPNPWSFLWRQERPKRSDGM